MSAPYFYQYIDGRTSSTSPTTFHSKNTALSRYFQRYLLQKVMSVLEVNGMPEEWDKDYFLYTLLTNGFIAVINTPEYGVIPQHCTLTGRNIFYQPASVLVSNPLLKSPIEARIGEECALIKLQPDYGNVLDIVHYYADLLAITSESIGVNIINSKLAMVFAAEDKASAESFKKMYDNLTSGEPAVFIDKKLKGVEGETTWETFIQNLSANYIGDKLIADLKQIENEFCSTIGIPNSNFEKNAHVLNAEVNANNADTMALLQLWLDTLKVGTNQVRDLFGINLTIGARTQEEEVEDYEISETVDSRSDELQG